MATYLLTRAQTVTLLDTGSQALAIDSPLALLEGDEALPRGHPDRDELVDWGLLHPDGPPTDMISRGLQVGADPAEIVEIRSLDGPESVTVCSADAAFAEVTVLADAVRITTPLDRASVASFVALPLMGALATHEGDRADGSGPTVDVHPADGVVLMTLAAAGRDGIPAGDVDAAVSSVIGDPESAAPYVLAAGPGSVLSLRGAGAVDEAVDRLRTAGLVVATGAGGGDVAVAPEVEEVLDGDIASAVRVTRRWVRPRRVRADTAFVRIGDRIVASTITPVRWRWWSMTRRETVGSIIRLTVDPLEVPPRNSRCPSCGAQNRAEASFCLSCGSNLRPAAAACPRCGENNRPGARFCKRCGESLAQTGP
jgi:ribosomal protein L32